LGYEVRGGYVYVVGCVPGVAGGHGSFLGWDVEASASIIDEDIEDIDFGGDVLECCFDGIVICDIELDAVDGAAGFGDFGLDFLDGCFYFLGITAAEVYFVGDCGLAEGFDGFVADSGVGASDEHDFGGHVGCL